MTSDVSNHMVRRLPSYVPFVSHAAGTEIYFYHSVFISS